MTKYAIIAINGNQYKVVENEEFIVDHLNGAKPEAKVLLVSDGVNVKIGNPEVSGVKVTLKTVEERIQGTKLHVKKFRAKSRYRKKIGFRPVYSKVVVEKIG